MLTTVNEENNDKEKEPDELVFVVFRSLVLLPNSMSKLLHNRCTWKLFIKNRASYVYAHEQLRTIMF